MKIGHDAFEYYISLGENRSYEAVARHYGATKRAVVSRATKERWQEKVEERDRITREALAKKSMESAAAIRDRQLKVVRTVQGKALEALRSMPLDTAINAVRALDMTLRQERAILGDPSEMAADSVELFVRDAYERWMKPSPEGEETTARKGART